MIRPFPFFVLMPALVACGPTARIESSADHPANPQAEEAPVPTRSTVLDGGTQLVPSAPGAAADEHLHTGHGKPPAPNAPASGKSAPTVPAPGLEEDHTRHAPPAAKP